MPDAMMNGGYAPYLAQAFTPSGVPGGGFWAGAGNVLGNINYPPLGPNFAAAGGLGGVAPIVALPPIGQAYPQAYIQPYGAWQQPQLQQGQLFAQPNIGWQQPFGQFSAGWQ